MTIRADVIVLGAGMVGVSVALHLRQRGRDVVLVDRRGAGEETSYGNSCLIQREGVIPYTTLLHGSVVRRQGLDGVSGPRS
jgi:D-amino-acid dehydrogenase